MKTKLSLVCLLLIPLFLGCGKDTLLEPEEQKNPELLPLAAGSSWEYSLYYRYESRNTSSGPYTKKWEYGYLKFELLREKSAKETREYELQVNFKLDSLYYHYDIPFLYDTTYIQYNPIDTLYYRTLVYANDTLWYKSADSLYMMMPDIAIEGSTIDLALFNAGGRYGGFFHWQPSCNSCSDTQEDYRGEWQLGMGAEVLTGFIRPGDGGIVQLDWWAQSGLGGSFISGYRHDLQYRLIRYVPGIIFEE